MLTEYGKLNDIPHKSSLLFLRGQYGRIFVWNNQSCIFRRLFWGINTNIPCKC